MLVPVRLVLVGMMIRGLMSFSPQAARGGGRGIGSRRFVRTGQTTHINIKVHDKADDNADAPDYDKVESISMCMPPSSPLQKSFDSLDLHPALLPRLHSQNLTLQTPIQSLSFPQFPPSTPLLIGAETGTGKTLSYLLPLVDEIMKTPPNPSSKYKTKAIILVPNRELSHQLLLAAARICGGPASVVHGAPQELESELARVPDSEPKVNLAILPGGLSAPEDFRPWRSPPPGLHADIVIATPAALAPLALDQKNLDLILEVDYLVMDECDLLLDGGYLKPLKDVLTGFRRRGKLDPSFGVSATRHVFVGATVPDYGTLSVDAFIKRRFPDVTRVATDGMHDAIHPGLVETRWEEVGGDQERLERLVEELQETDERVMVFVNTVEGVDLLTEALR